MAIQIIEERAKRPSTAQKFGQAFAGGVQGFNEYQQQQKSKKAISGLLGEGYENLPSDFQKMAYEAKLNKQQREDELSYNMRKAQAESDARKSLTPTGQPNNAVVTPPGINGPSEKTNQPSQANGQPQPQSKPQKAPVVSPEEVVQRGISNANQLRARGVNTTDEAEIALEDSKNNRNIAYNNNLETADQNKRNLQRTYGEFAVDKVTKLFPPDSPPSEAVQNYMQSKGEALAGSDKSEAQISAELGREATDLKNTISRIERSVGPKRLHTIISQGVKGTSREAEKQKEDIKIKLKPLLSKGFHEEARTLLSRLGYEPEEREELVSGLGEIPSKNLAQFPTFERSKYNEKDTQIPKFNPFSEEQTEKLNTSVFDTLKMDPATNLILLRKGYEEKGVNWDEFKNALNEAILSGQIKLNPDQLNALDILDEPPLNTLDKILYKFGFTGK